MKDYKDYIFTAFVISSGGFVLVTELEQTKPLYALIVGLVCLVYSIDCIVSAVKEFKQTEQKKAIDSTVQLRPYKIPKKVIEYYDESAPYFVVAEMPNNTEAEYWWASEKDIKDLQHSCVADKYVQLGHCVKANTLREEING